LAKVSSVALTARRLLAGGKLVDLTALEERVRAVCQAVEAMPKEEGQTLVEDMQALVGKLDQLSRELELRLAEVAGPEEPPGSAD
jgi:hypothetical protein